MMLERWKVFRLLDVFVCAELGGATMLTRSTLRLVLVLGWL